VADDPGTWGGQRYLTVTAALAREGSRMVMVARLHAMDKLEECFAWLTEAVELGNGLDCIYDLDAGERIEVQISGHSVTRARAGDVSDNVLFGPGRDD
jgi:hypothetical protein